jgi:hypothetical protein
MSNSMRPYQIAVYYFPNYHVDPRNVAQYGSDWTEWRLVQDAKPRYPGHQQPKVPVWGYGDESDPTVFAQKIDAAADHGIDAFIFDWYWYDDGPFLQRGLEQGFMGAANSDRLRFALMWANHNWVNIFPATTGKTPELLHPGTVTRQTFDQIIDHVVEQYWSHPSYWLVDGCPYFSVYELYRLVEGLGGLDATREALQYFRERTIAAGFPDLHLNAVVWGVQILPGEQTIENPNDLLALLGFDSVTSYVSIHHVPLMSFPTMPYADVQHAMEGYWQQARKDFTVPYYPNVTMGWDSSPRTVQDGLFPNSGYPYMAALADNTPAAFEDALQAARTFLDEQPSNTRILTINAWNEWTEGSYLEPDTINGMAYLEAIRKVFRA